MQKRVATAQACFFNKRSIFNYKQHLQTASNNCRQQQNFSTKANKTNKNNNYSMQQSQQQQYASSSSAPQAFGTASTSRKFWCTAALSVAALALGYLAIPNKLTYELGYIAPVESSKFKALVYGPTGAVGSALAAQLLQDEQCEKVTLVVRRPFNAQQQKDPLSQLVTSSSKVNVIVLPDFDRDFVNSSSNHAMIAQQTQGHDVVFFCLGTTRQQAGSAEAFEKIDKSYTQTAAQIANEANIKNFYYCSSIGADANSSFLYTRVKGEVENLLLQNSKFNNVMIARPSLLITTQPRRDSRFGESIAQAIAPVYDALMFGKLAEYKSIKVEDVAKAMIRDYKFQHAKKLLMAAQQEKQDGIKSDVAARRTEIVSNEALHYIASAKL